MLALLLMAALTQSPDEPTVAATVGGRPITLADVDARARRDDPGTWTRGMRMLSAARRKALDALIGEAVLAAAAEARGISVDELLRRELSLHTRPVGEAVIKNFYEANRAKYESASLDQMRELIRAHLAREAPALARKSLIEELRRTTTRVELALPPLRIAIAVRPGDPAEGLPDAPVEIIEFADYHSAFAKYTGETLLRAREEFGDRVRVVYKALPSSHPHARQAAEAARCAAEQNAFTPFRGRVVGSLPLTPERLAQHAVAAGLDIHAFEACLASGKHARSVAEDVADAKSAAVEEGPALFVNGRPVDGIVDYAALKPLIEEELSLQRRRRP